MAGPLLPVWHPAAWLTKKLLEKELNAWQNPWLEKWQEGAATTMFGAPSHAWPQFVCRTCLQGPSRVDNVTFQVVEVGISSIQAQKPC